MIYMKRVHYILISIILICGLCSCGQNIPYNAAYDTKTQQHIVIGDSRADVENIVGQGNEQKGKSSIIIDYNDGLQVFYDFKDSTVKEIQVYDYDVLTEDEHTHIEPRYKFFDVLYCGMKGEDVSKAFPSIKNFEEFFGKTSNDDKMKDNRYLSISYDSMSDKSSFSYDYTDQTDALLEISFEKGNVSHIAIYKWEANRKKDIPPPTK